MKTALTIAAFAAGTVGAFIGMAGSLRMAHAYHPFTTRDFVKHVLQVAALVFQRKTAEALNLVNTAVELGGITPENRNESLVGLYLVFLGFALQLCGGVLGLVVSLLY